MASNAPLKAAAFALDQDDDDDYQDDMMEAETPQKQSQVSSPLKEITKTPSALKSPVHTIPAESKNSELKSPIPEKKSEIKSPVQDLKKGLPAQAQNYEAEKVFQDTQDLDIDIQPEQNTSHKKSIASEKKEIQQPTVTWDDSQRPQLPPPVDMGIPLPLSHEEIDRELFNLYDLEGSGYIYVSDLEGMGRAMGWKQDSVGQLLQAIDPNHDERIAYDEFLLIMRHIEEQKMLQNQSSQLTHGSHNNSRLGGMQAGNTSSKYLSETDKKMYDALLPKQGVYFLPDEKLIAYLKVLNELRKKCEKDGDYSRARQMRDRFEELRSVEAMRQTENMRIAQEQELATIEGAQRVQFQEFNDAWDKYMADYEQAAFQSVEQLKERHIQELAVLTEKVIEESNSKTRQTKEVLDLRRQERVFFSVKEYNKAEAARQRADFLEQRERNNGMEQITEALIKQETNLRKKQQMALASLLKRIQRDREEQLKHRFEDAQRLMKRNANLVRDMLKKQNQEQRKTGQFLRYALGKREIKGDEEIMTNLRARVYQPHNDPLMPRIAKKYLPAGMNTTSQSINSHLNRNSTLGQNLGSTSSIKGGYAMHSNRLFSQDSNIFKQSARQQLGFASPTTTNDSLIVGGMAKLKDVSLPQMLSPEVLPKSTFNLQLQNANHSVFKSSGAHNMTRSMLLNTKVANEKADRQRKYMNKLAANQYTEQVVRQEVTEVIQQLPEKMAQARQRLLNEDYSADEQPSPRGGRKANPLSPGVQSYSKPSDLGKGSHMKAAQSPLR